VRTKRAPTRHKFDSGLGLERCYCMFTCDGVAVYMETHAVLLYCLRWYTTTWYGHKSDIFYRLRKGRTSRILRRRFARGCERLVV